MQWLTSGNGVESEKALGRVDEHRERLDRLVDHRALDLRFKEAILSKIIKFFNN